EAQRGSLVAQAELLGDAPALLVARHDRRFHPMETERLEPVPDHERDSFGHVPAAGALLVDPVADEARLERPAQHAPETHLAEQGAIVEEQAESVRSVELPLTFPRATARAERLAIGDRVG